MSKGGAAAKANRFDQAAEHYAQALLDCSTPAFRTSTEAALISVLKRSSRSPGVHADRARLLRRMAASVGASAAHRKRARSVLQPRFPLQLARHRGAVTSVAFSRDGRTYFSGGKFESLRMWDAQTGKLLRTIRAHTRGVHALALDPRSANVISGGGDGRVRVWAPSTGKLVKSFETGDMITGLAVDKAGRYVVAGVLNIGARILSLTGNKPARWLRYGAAAWVGPVAVDPGRRFLILKQGSDAGVLDWRTGKPLGRLENGEPMAMDRRGTQVVFHIDSGKIAHATLPSGKVLKKLQAHSKDVTAISISPDGRSVITGSADGTLRLWALPSLKALGKTTAHVGVVSAVAFGPRGERVLSGGTDGSLRLWAVPALTPVRTHRPCDYAVHAMTLATLQTQNNAGAQPVTTLALAGSDGTVRFWSLKTGALVRTLKGSASPVRALAVDSAGTTLVTGGEDKEVRLWTLSSGKLVRTLKGHRRAVRSVAIDVKNDRLASASDRAVRVWSVRKGTFFRQLEGQAPVAIDRPRKLLVSAHRSGAFHFHTLASLRAAFQLGGEMHDHGDTFALDSRTRMLATASHGSSGINLWNLRSKDMHSLEGTSNITGAPVAFGGQGRLLATGHFSSEKVRVFAMPGQTLSAELNPDVGKVRYLAFGPQGRILVVGGQRLVRIFALPSTAPLATLLPGAQGAWVVFTPDGHVDGTRRAAALLTYPASETYRKSRHWGRFAVPRLLARVLAGDHAYRLTNVRRLLRTRQ